MVSPPLFLQSLQHKLIHLPRPLKQLCAMSVDAALLLFSFCVAVWIRFEFFFFDRDYLVLAVVACVGGVGALCTVGLYRHILRYMSEKVVFLISVGALSSVALVVLFNNFLHFMSSLSRAVLVLHFLLALGALLGVRVLARLLLAPGRHVLAHTGVPILIYGAGSIGLQLVSALRRDSPYHPVGLIDDDPRKINLRMAGLRIHPPQRLPDLIERHQVQQLLIAMPQASRARIREIVNVVQPWRLRVRLVPGMRELIDAQHTLRLRDVQIEDLLGRDPVAPIDALLTRCVAGRAVMVTGAGGSIGSELCRQILRLAPTCLVLYDISEAALYTLTQDLAARNGQNIPVISVLGSVRDQAHCLQQIRRYGIQTIYHAAAYKHVPIVEANVAEGIRTNTLGTLALTRAAMEGGVRDFVLISTDKAVRPTNVMGASKRLAEMVLQGAAQMQNTTRFVMVRFGNVLGSSGSVVPLFQRQIMGGGPVTLTHLDIIRYFMTIPEAAGLVLQAGAMGGSGSVYVLDMGEPVRIQDLAVKMIQMYGLTVRDEDTPNGDIEIRVTGLRPGEKLFEELLIGDDAQATEHPKIMQAQEQYLPYTDLCQGLTELQTALDDEDVDRTLALLRRLVPEYGTMV